MEISIDILMYCMIHTADVEYRGIHGRNTLDKTENGNIYDIIIENA